MSTELSTEQRLRAVELMLGTVRERFPDVGEAARPLFEDQVGHWDVARVWETDHAMVVLTETVPAKWGAPEPHLHVLTDGTPRSVEWFGSLTDEISNALGPSVACRIGSTRPALVEPLRSLGLGVSKLGLGGDVAVMLEHVERLRLVDPRTHGLRLAPVATMEHVRASSALRRDYFLSHPEHGWASGTMTPAQQRAIDERVERSFQRRLEEQLGADFMLLHDDEVVASFGFTRPQPSPIVGINASFNICIAPEWHGRGLGTLAYAVMVRRAAELNVEYMHGSTSNAGVIHIAAKLGRTLDNWLLRLDPPWIDDELAMMPALLPAME